MAAIDLSYYSQFTSDQIYILISQLQELAQVKQISERKEKIRKLSLTNFVVDLNLYPEFENSENIGIFKSVVYLKLYAYDKENNKHKFYWDSQEIADRSYQTELIEELSGLEFYEQFINFDLDSKFYRNKVHIPHSDIWEYEKNGSATTSKAYVDVYIYYKKIPYSRIIEDKATVTCVDNEGNIHEDNLEKIWDKIPLMITDYEIEEE